MSRPDEQATRMRIWIIAGTMALVAGTLYLGFLAMQRTPGQAQGEDEFIRLSNVGKNYLDSGEAAKAVEPFTQALAIYPNHTNALLNLANAQLRANQPGQALALAGKARGLDPHLGAAHYIEGCAALRLGQFTNAVQALQQAKQIDRTVNAVSFQLGRAYQSLGQFELAVEQFQEVVQFDPAHPAAFYNLSQALLRLGRQEEARQALETHQQLAAGRPSQITDPAVFEQCLYTQARVPFKLAQPDRQGVSVQFVDRTEPAFGGMAGAYQGPIGLVDFERRGEFSILAREGSGSFRWLKAGQIPFQPMDQSLPAESGSVFHQCLVGDLNNDHMEDVLLLGEPSSLAFKLATNGTAMDISRFSRANQIAGRLGRLVDLDFTGKLDLLSVGGANHELRVLRNLGQPYFLENTTNSGLPPERSGLSDLAVVDYNADHLLDLILAKPGQPPELYVKQRGGALILTNTPAAWPQADHLAFGDLNNDLLPDLAALSGGALRWLAQGKDTIQTLPGEPVTARHLLLWDYDQDGWLDILTAGRGLRLWRNQGLSGFAEVTDTVGLDACASWNVAFLLHADLDMDGDSDLLLALEEGGLRLLGNDGANANHLLKVHLVGTKSNASGLGIQLEVTAGGLRLIRRVERLPVEIGVGPNAKVESLTAHWSDFSVNNIDVPAEPRQLATAMELVIPVGSCPYLYAWNGARFEFVTDLLGAAPLGLPLNEHRLVEADPFEHVHLGDDRRFPARDGRYTVQITEELREVLYLDEAKLTVIDHPPGTEVHTTGKLLPRGPFSEHRFMTLHRRQPLRQALTHQGEEVTAALEEIDGHMVSPARLRPAQTLGLAEPHHLILDFGPIRTEAPLVLALTGWLRFGGGMANMSAARDPDLPFPFPTLEAETGDGQWSPVDVTVGAPAGKTKTILVDLERALPATGRRLRLSTAFEIHWDRIALWENAGESDTMIHHAAPDRTDLHARGFSAPKDLPWHQPWTPDYERVESLPAWRLTPMGWCTRYGAVDELIGASDNGLALLNGGDELTLEWEAAGLPGRKTGAERTYFLYLVGWDKDSDFHCALGWQVEPLPWHGMDDQVYGRQPRPRFPSDALMERLNTRWVGPKPLTMNPARLGPK